MLRAARVRGRRQGVGAGGSRRPSGFPRRPARADFSSGIGWRAARSWRRSRRRGGPGKVDGWRVRAHWTVPARLRRPPPGSTGCGPGPGRLRQTRRASPRVPPAGFPRRAWCRAAPWPGARTSVRPVALQRRRQSPSCRGGRQYRCRRLIRRRRPFPRRERKRNVARHAYGRTWRTTPSCRGSARSCRWTAS